MIGRLLLKTRSIMRLLGWATGHHVELMGEGKIGTIWGGRVEGWNLPLGRCSLVMSGLGRGRLEHIGFCSRLFQIGDICFRCSGNGAHEGSGGSHRLKVEIVIISRRLFVLHRFPNVGYTEVPSLNLTS